ncbi:MAG: hypothetical protein ACRD2W_10580 [Acidimicrobiales bacterium]
MLPFPDLGHHADKIFETLAECPTAFTAWGQDVEAGVVAASGVVEFFVALVECFNTTLDGGAQDTLRSLGLTSVESSFFKALGRLSTAVRIAAAAIAVIDTGRAASAAGPVTMVFRAPPPPVPPTQPTDGRIGGTSPTSGHLIKQPGTPASHLVDRVARHVPFGNTYICLAERVPTRYEVDDTLRAELVDGLGPDATCPEGVEGLELRSLPPGTAEGFLLRSGDGTKNHLVVDGFRVSPFSAASHFSCLARSHLVWDWVTDAELDWFRPTRSWPRPAVCRLLGPPHFGPSIRDAEPARRSVVTRWLSAVSRRWRTSCAPAGRSRGG